MVPRRRAVLDRPVAAGHNHFCQGDRCREYAAAPNLKSTSEIRNPPMSNGRERTSPRCSRTSCRRRRSAFMCDLLDRGERAFFGRLMAPESELGPIIKAFHGRLYFNLSQLRRVSRNRRRSARRHAAIARPFRSRFGPRTKSPSARRSASCCAALPDLIRLVVNALRARAHLSERIGAHRAGRSLDFRGRSAATVRRRDRRRRSTGGSRTSRRR